MLFNVNMVKQFGLPVLKVPAPRYCICKEISARQPDVKCGFTFPGRTWDEVLLPQKYETRWRESCEADRGKGRQEYTQSTNDSCASTYHSILTGTLWHFQVPIHDIEMCYYPIWCFKDVEFSTPNLLQRASFKSTQLGVVSSTSLEVCVLKRRISDTRYTVCVYFHLDIFLRIF